MPDEVSGASVVPIAGWIDQFQGYSITNKGPTFDLQVIAATVELGAAKEQRHVVRTEERVPYLSDIPTIGRLFVKRQTETNYLRSVLIIRRLMR